MAELRVLVNKTTRTGTRERVYRVDANRVGVYEYASDGTTKLVSKIYSNAEWNTHVKLHTAFEAVAPGPAPTPPPTPVPSGYVRPYRYESPWNTPCVDSPVDPNSAAWISALSAGGPIGANPEMYAGPLYRFNASTPMKTIQVTGSWSAFDKDEWTRVGGGTYPASIQIPWPGGVAPSPGDDGHIIFWDVDRGITLAFWRFDPSTMTAQNGHRAICGNTAWGTFFGGLAGRGAGTPYLAGLVTKAEVDAGSIDHAICIAVTAASGTIRYPASKSDQTGSGPPMGALMRLKANYDASAITSKLGRLLVQAAKTYGMYIIDGSGHNKIYIEANETSGWTQAVEGHVLEGIPISAFEIVACPVAKPAGP